MSDYIFNEKLFIQQLVENQSIDANKQNGAIVILAKYCYHILKHNEKQAYSYIVKYMKAHAAAFNEQDSLFAIKSAIRKARKTTLKHIEHVPITQKELQTIASIGDIKQEKLAFVLLADAKYQTQVNGYLKSVSYLSIAQLFKLARVPCPYKERALMTSFLYEDRKTGALAVKEPTGKKFRWKLTYASYDSDDQVVLKLGENNYKELAFTYLNWKEGGYKECKSCGKLFKAKANAQYCKKCAPKEEPLKYKIIHCVDCGCEVYIKPKDNQTDRCNECYQAYRKEKVKENVHRYRDNVISTNPV